MVNLNWFADNATTLEINTTIINNPDTIFANMLTNANIVSLGYYGLSVMSIVFIYLIIVTFNQSGDLRFDIARSVVIGSGFASLFGIIMATTGLLTSYLHVMWFFTLFVLSIISVYVLKTKGG